MATPSKALEKARTLANTRAEQLTAAHAEARVALEAFAKTARILVNSVGTPGGQAALKRHEHDADRATRAMAAVDRSTQAYHDAMQQLVDVTVAQSDALKRMEKR